MREKIKGARLLYKSHQRGDTKGGGEENRGKSENQRHTYISFLKRRHTVFQPSATLAMRDQVLHDILSSRQNGFLSMAASVASPAFAV